MKESGGVHEPAAAISGMSALEEAPDFVGGDTSEIADRHHIRCDIFACALSQCFDAWITQAFF